MAESQSADHSMARPVCVYSVIKKTDSVLCFAREHRARNDEKEDIHEGRTRRGREEKESERTLVTRGFFGRENERVRR